MLQGGARKHPSVAKVLVEISKMQGNDYEIDVSNQNEY